MKNARFLLIVLACAGLAACTDARDSNAAQPGPIDRDSGTTEMPSQPSHPSQPSQPSQPAQPSVIASTEAGLAFAELKTQAEMAESLDATGALASYPTDFVPELSYDPSLSLGLDTIQGSALPLSDIELAKLGQQGFTISKRHAFATFLRGYAEIYSEHLPVYISADSILESVHSSYDEILLALEYAVLLPTLAELLGDMQDRIASSGAAASVKADANTYLAVAESLLAGSVIAPSAGGDAALVRTIYDKALAAEGIENVTLFGVPRMEDFSQFKPRGHYTEVPELEQYFRAMMWLGRVDFRFLETMSDGSQVFRPEQYQAMLFVHELLQPDMAKWQRIDDVIRTFVGESDYMVVPEVESLVGDLGGLAAAKSATQQQVIDAIIAGGYGEQQIASHLMVNDGTVETLPLNRSFCVFGQRYIPDSHVFSEVVYDRIGGRMMPNPLDAAFAALGNNQALALNQEELETFGGLPGALARMRVLIDAHDATFWESNFYNLWMDALRALSPVDGLSTAEGVPEVAKTEAWGRRMLNAQLGSWAQLRHDTLLYAKQSYTGIPACEFPDAYVDPYPEFYAAIAKYAAQGNRIAQLAAGAPNTDLEQRITAYFSALLDAATKLGAMAEAQRRGEMFSEEQMTFINQAVRVIEQSAGCTTVETSDGWYAKLFFNPEKSLEFDPTIADVHTQPADEVGNIVGRVLHVGTGSPRYFVTTIDTCSGPRAYAGVVFAYHESITEDFERWTDEEWATTLQSGTPQPDVPWMTSVMAE